MAETLRAVPRDHFGEAASAREKAEPLLRAWEARSEIETGERIEFRFQSANVIDRQPSPPGSAQVVAVAGIASASIVGGGSVVVGHGQYPSPPTRAFAATDLVEYLRDRIREILTGRQRLLVASQLCLTKLEGAFGSRENAAAALNVAATVLDHLGVVGQRNDPVEGRKAKGREQPLTNEEKAQIVEILKRLALRAGEVAAGTVGLSQITLGDFRV